MTSLGLVGIADKGTYSAEATYNKGQFVLHDGSTWLALKDNLNGVTPAEGENWKYLARGFAAELLSLVTAIDSQGLSGSQGGRVNAQSLIDVLADKVANQLIAKSMMSNVQVNDSGKVPTSALAYAMQQSIETLNSKTKYLQDNLFMPTDVLVGKYSTNLYFVDFSEWLCFIVPVFSGNTYRFEGLSINEAVYICSLNGSKNIIQNVGASQNMDTVTYTVDQNGKYICVNVGRESPLPKMYHVS